MKSAQYKEACDHIGFIPDLPFYRDADNTIQTS